MLFSVSSIAKLRDFATYLAGRAPAQDSQTPATSADGRAPEGHPNRHTRDHQQHDEKGENKGDNCHSVAVNLRRMEGV